MPVDDCDATQTAHITGHRWRIAALLMGYAAIGHFNRVGIATPFVLLSGTA